MLRPLGTLSLSGKCTLLRMPSTDSLFSSGPHPASCDHDEKKNHRVSLRPFILLLLFIFFPWVRVLSYVCQRKPAQNSAGPATSQRPLQRLLNSKPISHHGETLSCKDGGQRESFKHKSYASTNPRLLLCWCHFNVILASLKKSMRVLNMWLMIVQVYAIAPIAVNVGYPKFSFS